MFSETFFRSKVLSVTAHFLPPRTRISCEPCPRLLLAPPTADVKDTHTSKGLGAFASQARQATLMYTTLISRPQVPHNPGFLTVILPGSPGYALYLSAQLAKVFGLVANSTDFF